MRRTIAGVAVLIRWAQRYTQHLLWRGRGRLPGLAHTGKRLSRMPDLLS